MTQRTGGNFWKFAFFICFLALGYFGYSYYSGKGKVAPCPSAQLTASEEKQDTSWPRTDFMGSYSFAYPTGWHVSNQWQVNNGQNQGQTVMILIDPKPINTAPRGGPLSTIMISDKSGLQNPDEVFDKDRQAFKDALQDLKEEVIQSDFGPIYHYQGKIDVYGQMVAAEKYYFTVQGKINNNVNKHLIAASLETDPSKSEILRKIVTSFKTK